MAAPDESPYGLQDLEPAERARRTKAIAYMARTFPGSATDPHGLERLSRSRAQTPAGIGRLFNKVAKEWGLGEPTRAEVRASRAEARGQKLKPQQIDRNAYRHPVVRARPPRDMPKRRAPGWAATNFVLPKATIMGLSFLARSIADRERAQRASQPYGLKRLYPKTRNFYVLQALNQLFEDYGLKQFCVEHPRLEREQVT